MIWLTDTDRRLVHEIYVKNEPQCNKQKLAAAHLCLSSNERTNERASAVSKPSALHTATMPLTKYRQHHTLDCNAAWPAASRNSLTSCHIEAFTGSTFLNIAMIRS